MEFRNNEIAALLNSRAGECMDAEAGGGGVDGQCDVAYVLFLEPTHDPRRSAGEQCLDVAIRNFQPAPALAHCELLLPPLPAGEAERTQFATYLGKQSGWQVDRQDGFGFYLAAFRQRFNTHCRASGERHGKELFHHLVHDRKVVQID